MINENLSHQLSENGWKNSWHVYADVPMLLNADACMKDLKKEQVWGRLKHRKDMWCEIKLKPLINLDIYTKDWAFKVVGSVKWHDRTYRQLTVSFKEFFMATRMAYRTGIPSFSNIRTSEVFLWGGDGRA